MRKRDDRYCERIELLIKTVCIGILGLIFYYCSR